MPKISISPLFKIVLSFILIILVGFCLLMLPFATTQGIKWYDALFTAFSAVCVTGLSPVADVSQTFTAFGIVVIAFLIQIGGLGFVTIAVFIMSILGGKIGYNDRILVKEALNQSTQSGIIKLVIKIIKTTFIIEFLAFLINMIVFVPEFGLQGVGISLFHAISTFNNAGFDILGSSSLIAYSDNILFVLSTSVFIILGGLGFIVMHDILEKKSWKKLTIHSKIVIKMTVFLLVSGTLLFKFSESVTTNISWLDAFFLSVTARTAGFATISFASINSITLLIMCLYMFVGASPSSTGGGVKTTTLYTIYKSISSYMKGKKPIIYNREVSKSSRHRAFMLFFMGIACILFYTIVILSVEMFFKVRLNGELESSVGFSQVFFEVVSAFGTVGLSTGITSTLEPLSKVILCTLMFFGRLGPLTIFSLLNRNYYKPEDSNEVEYLEENIIVG